MPVTDLHVTSGKHPACREDTVSVSWEYHDDGAGLNDGKRHALWVSAKTGRSHFGTCPAKRKPALSDEDKELAESLGAKSVAQMRRVLAAKENQALRESVRKAGG
jgi:hypothetical protein